MKTVNTIINYKGKDYLLVFNLNVMEAIQEEYKTLDAWGALTDGKAGEVNIKALVFGLACMLNEGVEISNENNNTNEPLLTHKQVGRMISEIGLENLTRDMNDLVVNSTKDDSEPKNA